jgi:hypothetical protein
MRYTLLRSLLGAVLWQWYVQRAAAVDAPGNNSSCRYASTGTAASAQASISASLKLPFYQRKQACAGNSVGALCQ